jgi:hypothetical protein
MFQISTLRGLSRFHLQLPDFLDFSFDDLQAKLELLLPAKARVGNRVRKPEASNFSSVSTLLRE